jgi:hypothetical protein
MGKQAFVAITDATVGVPTANLQNKAYFEVTLLKTGKCPQLGWVSSTFEKTDESSEGIGAGDTEDSWAVDGVGKQAWHAGKETPGYDIEWAAGDVIGFALDREAGKVLFAHNGEWLANSPFGPLPHGDVTPALSILGDAPGALLVNLGGAPFRHLPPETYQAIAPEATVADLERLRGFPGSVFVEEDLGMTRDAAGRTPFDAAARGGDADRLQAMIADGTPVDSRQHNEEGAPVLYIASKEGHTECVKVALGAGADMNVQTTVRTESPAYAPLALRTWASATPKLGSPPCA